MSRNWAAWFVFVVICFGASAIGSVFTASSVKMRYPSLLKPPGTPPSWVLGPVWSVLYLLMATGPTSRAATPRSCYFPCSAYFAFCRLRRSWLGETRTGATVSRRLPATTLAGP